MWNNNDNIDDLLELIRENPGLPVIPLIGGEICNGNIDYVYFGSFGECYIAEYIEGEENVHIRDDDDLDAVCDTLEDFLGTYDYDEMYDYPDEKIYEVYKELPWAKAIIVPILER